MKKFLQTLVEHEIQEKKTVLEYVKFGFTTKPIPSHKENLFWLLKKNNPNKRIRIIEAGK